MSGDTMLKDEDKIPAGELQCAIQHQVQQVQQVLTASDDETAKVWNAATGECTQTLSGHIGVLRSAIFSPDGLCVLTASDDETAKVWNAATENAHRHCQDILIYCARQSFRPMDSVC